MFNRRPKISLSQDGPKLFIQFFLCRDKISNSVKVVNPVEIFLDECFLLASLPAPSHHINYFCCSSKRILGVSLFLESRARDRNSDLFFLRDKCHHMIFFRSEEPRIFMNRTFERLPDVDVKNWRQLSNLKCWFNKNQSYSFVSPAVFFVHSETFTSQKNQSLSFAHSAHDNWSDSTLFPSKNTLLCLIFYFLPLCTTLKNDFSLVSFCAAIY